MRLVLNKVYEEKLATVNKYIADLLISGIGPSRAKLSHLFIFTLASASFSPSPALPLTRSFHIIALFFLLAPAAFSQNRELHETYDINPNGTVSVMNTSGFIRVSSWNENRVRIDAVKRGRNEEELDQVQIQVNATPTRIEVRTIYARSRTNVSVDYDLKVPGTVILNSITSTSGDVTLTGPILSATARSTSGDVVAKEIREAATLASTSGNVTAEKIGGELRANSTSGDVHVNDVGFRLTAASTGGNVTASQIRDDATATATSGSVKLEKIGGRATGRSSSGAVVIQDVGGDVQADSLSDSVTVSDVRGRAVVSSISADVTVRRVEEGVRATSISGAVDLSDVKGRVEASTTSGSVRLMNIDSRDVIAKALSGEVRYTGRLYEDGHYNFESFSSNVILFLPADSQFRLTARSRSGSINTEFPLQVSGQVAERGSMTGTVGNGSADLRAATFSGSVYLKKSTAQK
jgi:DUF4097 and DUF4098 domain-containing protein YvlB